MHPFAIGHTNIKAYIHVNKACMGNLSLSRIVLVLALDYCLRKCQDTPAEGKKKHKTAFFADRLCAPPPAVFKSFFFEKAGLWVGGGPPESSTPLPPPGISGIAPGWKGSRNPEMPPALPREFKELCWGEVVRKSLNSTPVLQKSTNSAGGRGGGILKYTPGPRI